jgi:hypothetical protein
MARKLRVGVRISRVFGLLLALTGCASGLTQTDGGYGGPSRRTTVLFVVDGLGAGLLQEGFRGDGLPNLRTHFLRGANGFPLARASFPTLTYPNLSSILTARKVGEQPVIANHMVIERGEILDFESHSDHGELRRQIDPRTVIARLKAGGRRTASFSYVLGMNADDHMEAGLGEGLEYTAHDYRALDGRLLDSLGAYLTDVPRAEAWPEFIYVHLVGVDGTAHRFGERSAETRGYLAWLDARMGRVLRTLRAGEAQGHRVVSLLTADHGFVDPTAYSDAAMLFRQPGLIVTNESRFLGVHLAARGEKRPAALRPLLAQARGLASVELTALREGDDLTLSSGDRQLRFRFGPAVCGEETFSLAPVSEKGPGAPACPSAFDALVPPYPYLVANLATYLNAKYHPDALVIAKPRYSFQKGDKGAHGGPTADEVLVPLLLRGLRTEGPRPIHTSELLKILE